MEFVAVILFFLIFLIILRGFPVAFVLGGVSVLVGLIFVPDFFSLLPMRIMGTMKNQVLIAVPLFVFMGFMLEKSGLADGLLETMAILFGKVKGGLAISVVIVGALLAASTGIVGATVITMGLISLPTMIKRNYSLELATGTIISSGTLGQIIPPSVVLVLLGSVLNVPVGDLFKAALIPGLILILGYIGYIFIISKLKPEYAPAIPKEEIDKFKGKGFVKRVITSLLFPLSLIILVLGSIFAGIASPTEAAAVGALGSILLAIIKGKCTFEVFSSVNRSTLLVTSMVFMILLGANTFSLVFRALGGDDMIVQLIQTMNFSPFVFLLIIMVLIFIIGFFIDFIEIIFIIIPVIYPALLVMEIDLIWFGILMALNLQTSFLTPPFGFALFYLKGVAPPEVTTKHIYRGIIPFMCIQLAILLIVMLFPSLIQFLM